MRRKSKLKPVAAGTADGLQIIERFGRLLEIKDMPSLDAWQTAPLHVIYVEPVGRGQFAVRCDDKIEDVLLISRQPLLDSARELLWLGCDPSAKIIMRRRGSDRDDLIGIIGHAAKYTVDETKTIFVKWKPFPGSAVKPPSASAAASPSGVAPARKTLHEIRTAFKKPTDRRPQKDGSDIEPDAAVPTVAGLLGCPSPATARPRE